MLIKCMLPISLVDSAAFRDYIKFLDPSFSMPTRRTINDTALPKLKEICQKRIKDILNNIATVTVCTDLWSDCTARPFNGFIAQGLDTEWKLHCLPIEFDFIEGIHSFIIL